MNTHSLKDSITLLHRLDLHCQVSHLLVCILNESFGYSIEVLIAKLRGLCTTK